MSYHFQNHQWNWRRKHKTSRIN